MKNTSGTPAFYDEGEEASSASGRELPPWDVYSAFVAVISGYILLPLMFSKVLLLINPFLDNFQQFLVQQVMTVVTWTCIFSFLHWRHGGLVRHLGLRLTQPSTYYLWETVKLILLTTAISLALSLLWMLLEKYMPGLLPVNDPPPYSGFSLVELQVLSLFAVLIAPLQEELIFRGLVQTTLHRMFSATQSVLLTGLVFLSLHGSYFGNIKALSQVFLLGLCFGVWRERTRSLLPGVVAHLFNNGMASYLLLRPH